MKAIVALASWGVAVKTKFERDSVDGHNVAPLDDTAPKVTAGDELFGDAKLEAAIVNKPAPMPAPAKPNRSTRPKSSAFMKPKPPRKDMGISRAPQLTQPGFEKATRTNIIEEEVPGLAEETAKRVEKKQTGKKGNNVFSKGANPAPVPRMRKDKNGELQFRKPRSVAVCEKRKRREVMDAPNKRAAVEGRSFAPPRTRRVATLSDATAIDALPAPFLPIAL
ncbi:hypothetical protein BDU57DRAFT_328387 [Ampelomyces quisqualis]|uniref:Uncharacterized protein n=1 Tax=Ampelomyces quisqualis TaxID=50730 RepID=A0A6A5QGL2_AMPQU|nr:hypothetical protein BDU57DRAFT_328387 [Ampelomyces quisqualis]